MTELRQFNPEILKLYLIISEADIAPKGLEESVLAAIKGGVSLIQLRDKHASDEDFLNQVKRIQPTLKAHNVPLILNDRLHLVEQAGAEGIHLGQSDHDAVHARQILGPDKIIGLSITEHVDLDEIPTKAIDYIGLYPIFATATKMDAGPALGLKRAEKIIQNIEVPIVGIGGITAKFAEGVVHAGCAGVSVISAICKADDIEAAAREFIEVL